jgi:hypothetical protein
MEKYFEAFVYVAVPALGALAVADMEEARLLGMPPGDSCGEPVIRGTRIPVY